MSVTGIKKLFEYYKKLGTACIDRLSLDELKSCPHPESNSVAIMVKHMHGNMLSRWTDFLTSDGEKEWRTRDAEFVDEYSSIDEILSDWNAGWDCLFNAVNPLNEGDMEKEVFIRNEGHTVLEALQRQLAHYAYHVGQMVFLAKLIKGDNWESLSIPRNQSSEYNRNKFTEQKTTRHFTDKV